MSRFASGVALVGRSARLPGNSQLFVGCGLVWQLAEAAGHPNPDRLQGFLAKAAWDADDLRDRVRDYAVAALADQDAVLIADETGDLQKGAKSAGVQRQYTGKQSAAGHRSQIVERRLIQKRLTGERGHQPRAAAQHVVHHAEGIGLVRLPRVVPQHAGKYPGNA